MKFKNKIATPNKKTMSTLNFRTQMNNYYQN